MTSIERGALGAAQHETAAILEEHWRGVLDAYHVQRAQAEDEGKSNFSFRVSLGVDIVPIGGGDATVSARIAYSTRTADVTTGVTVSDQPELPGVE